MDQRLVEMTRTVAVIVDVSSFDLSSFGFITMKHPNWWGDVVKSEHQSPRSGTKSLRVSWC